MTATQRFFGAGLFTVLTLQMVPAEATPIYRAPNIFLLDEGTPAMDWDFTSLTYAVHDGDGTGSGTEHNFVVWACVLDPMSTTTLCGYPAWTNGWFTGDADLQPSLSYWQDVQYEDFFPYVQVQAPIAGSNSVRYVLGDH